MIIDKSLRKKGNRKDMSKGEEVEDTKSVLSVGMCRVG